MEYIHLNFPSQKSWISLKEVLRIYELIIHILKGFLIFLDFFFKNIMKTSLS